MSRLFKYFLRGLVVVAPLAITVYVCVLVFRTIDGWLGLSIPGIGFVLTILLILLVGFLASGLFTRGVVGALGDVFKKLPFVRLLYSSSKDMLTAFVGEKGRFDKPVLVSLSADGSLKVLAFLTSDSLASLGVSGHVSVYMPQSYGLAGHILVVPADRVQRIEADATAGVGVFFSGGGPPVSCPETPPRGACGPPPPPPPGEGARGP